MRTLILALSVFAALPASAENCRPLTRLATLPFETDADAHIFLPATLMGRSTRLAIDTGGTWGMIHERLAKSLNLQIRTSNNWYMVDAAGEKIDKFVTVTQMTIGNIAAPVPQDFFISRSSHVRPIIEMGGTLGMNFFKNMDLEIDNAAKTISLYRQDHCRGEGVHWADEAVTLNYRVEKSRLATGTRLGKKKLITLPVFTAELEGEEIGVLFDTGSTDTFMDSDLAQRRFGLRPGSPGVQPAGRAHVPSGEEVDLHTYTFNTLTISGIRFENVPVYLGEFDTRDLILGMHELRHLHMYFALNDGMIHITTADAGRTPEAGKPK